MTPKSDYELVEELDQWLVHHPNLSFDEVVVARGRLRELYSRLPGSPLSKRMALWKAQKVAQDEREPCGRTG